MKFLREFIFYALQFFVLLIFANLNLILLEVNVLYQVVFALIVIIYFSLGSRTLEYNLAGYTYEVVNDKKITLVLSIVLRIIISSVLIYLLMLYFYTFVIVIFIAEYLTQEFNELSIFEFLTLSRVERN